jgi:hypothetical protein
MSLAGPTLSDVSPFEATLAPLVVVGIWSGPDILYFSDNCYEVL